MFEVFIIRDWIKIIFLCLFSYFSYFKITNSKGKTKNLVFIIVQSAISASIYILLNNYFNSIIAFLLTFFIYMIMLIIIMQDDIILFAVGYVLSIIIVYLIYLLSTLIVATIFSTLIWQLDYTSIWFVIPIIVLATLFYYALFSTKRFKNGFNFLKNELICKKIIMIISIFLASILLILGLTKMDTTRFQKICIVVILLLVSAIVYEFIRKLITQYYKKHMRDRTIEMQKKEIDEHLDNIENIKAENIRLATIIHKYNSRISALEKGINKAINNMNTEFASELSVMLDETTGIAKELEEQTKRNVNIPSTGFFGIDNMFQFMYDECINNDVNFSLKITNNINYLVENVVKKEKLETLIGDHIKDAIIAINSGTPEYKSILCILGIVRDAYEFSVYDTGIDFEIDTLLKLGIEQVTTHKDNGGSGIGFMTTFETMKECSASLIIEEYDKATTHYTKSVTIRFDGKNEYKIYSYRYKEIKKKCKDKRISISGIE